MQRHITGVLANTRVFDEKYPGIFQYPGFMMSHYRDIDKYKSVICDQNVWVRDAIMGYLKAANGVDML